MGLQRQPIIFVGGEDRRAGIGRLGCPDAYDEGRGYDDRRKNTGLVNRVANHCTFLWVGSAGCSCARKAVLLRKGESLYFFDQFLVGVVADCHGRDIDCDQSKSPLVGSLLKRLVVTTSVHALLVCLGCIWIQIQ